MSNAIVSFFKGEFPPSVTWGKVREEILRSCENMKIKFEATPYYYTVTSGKKTWYWKLETGEFDGISWEVG